MKLITIFTIVLGIWSSILLTASESPDSKSRDITVIPFLLDDQLLEEFEIEHGIEAWFELAYAASPESETIHQEAAEKLWWIQGQGLLLLGSTGLPLPKAVTSRATAYVWVFWNGIEIHGSPFLLKPQDHGLVTHPYGIRDQSDLPALAPIDPKYSQRIADVLVDITHGSDRREGTTSKYSGDFSIDGEENRKRELCPWTYQTSPANLIRAFPGGIGRNGATLFGNSGVSSHINLGNLSITGQPGENIFFCTVSGGIDNDASGQSSTVSGGEGNTAQGGGSTVCGGLENMAQSPYSTVGGGYSNLATQGGSTISGGTDNTAIGINSCIGGGWLNCAAGSLSVVTGGKGNSAGGQLSVVSGGEYNTTGGDYSWVGGKGMNLGSSARNTFAWGSSDPSMEIATPDAFLIFPHGIEGSVGIRTDTPASPLHVGGGSDTHPGGGGFLTLGLLGSSNICMDNNEIMARNKGNSSDLFLNHEGGNVILCTHDGRVGIGTQYPSQELQVMGDICATGFIGRCSDRRYKKDVTPIANALETVSRIQGVDYRWRQAEFPDQKFSDQKQTGFIAQDLKAVIPQIVSKDQDGFYSVDYAKLSPILVEAIKTLREENEVLTSALKVQYTLNTKIEDRIRLLEETISSR